LNPDFPPRARTNEIVNVLLVGRESALRHHHSSGEQQQLVRIHGSHHLALAQ
jgi:hypothetical protein